MSVPAKRALVYPRVQEDMVWGWEASIVEAVPPLSLQRPGGREGRGLMAPRLIPATELGNPSGDQSQGYW